MNLGMWRVLGVWVSVAVGVVGCTSGPTDVCGDSLVSGAEECDDGNARAGDGCSTRCTTESGYVCVTGGSPCEPRCNDGLLVDEEVCDPSASGMAGYCSFDCTMITGRCGDGIVQAAQEQCDDTNGERGDGCDVCHPSLGFTCMSSTNTCDASIVDPSTVVADMTAQERMDFCTWQVGFLGPAGRRYSCPGSDFIVRSVSDCVTAVAGLPASVSHCTVEDFERWTAERTSACDFFQNTTLPCAPATASHCSQLDISCTTTRPTCGTDQVPEVEASGLCWTGSCVPQTSCACTAYYDCPSGRCDTATGRCMN